MRFQLIQKIERGLPSLRGIRSLFIGDAHLKVCRHGAMIQLVDVSHGFSPRRRRPQKDQGAGPNSKELWTKILEQFLVLVGRLGGGDVKIRSSGLLTRLPKS